MFQLYQRTSVGLTDTDIFEDQQQTLLPAPLAETTNNYIVGISEATQANTAKEMITGLAKNPLKSLHINHDIYKDSQSSQQVSFFCLFFLVFLCFCAS